MVEMGTCLPRVYPVLLAREAPSPMSSACSLQLHRGCSPGQGKGLQGWSVAGWDMSCPRDMEKGQRGAESCVKEQLSYIGPSRAWKKESGAGAEMTAVLGTWWQLHQSKQGAIAKPKKTSRYV